MDQGTCRDENDEISENFGIIFLNVGTWIVIDHAKANFNRFNKIGWAGGAR